MTSVEFSLLAIPYFTLTMAIIELALMFTTASMLEGATGAAARMLRTGQIQQATSDPAAQAELFRETLCNNAVVLVNCDDVAIETVNIGSFGSYGDYIPQFDDDGNFVPQGFDAGGVSDVLLIRTALRYSLMTPFIGQLLGEGSSNTRLFMSTIVLQSEPYEFEDEPGV